MPNYVLDDADSFQSGLTAFDKVSFEKSSPDKEIIFGEVEDVDKTTSEVCVGIGYPSVGYSSPFARMHVYVTVKDFTTGAVVPGARVTVDGTPYTAGEDGRAYVGLRKENTLHTLKITKDGYKDSDVDEIANDSFTTPEITE